MYPYLKTEDDEEEFKDILEIAWLLFSQRKTSREIAENRKKRPMPLRFRAKIQEMLHEK